MNISFLKRIKGSLLFEAGVLVFLGLLMADTFKLVARSAKLPVLIGVITIFLTLADMILSSRKEWIKSGNIPQSDRDSAPKPAAFPWLLFWGTIGFMVLTIAGWSLIGFIPTSILVTMGYSYFLGARNMMRLTLASVLITACLYLIFGTFLGVPLPVGYIGRLI